MMDEDQISDILDEHVEAKSVDGWFHVIEIIFRSEEILEVWF